MSAGGPQPDLSAPPAPTPQSQTYVSNNVDGHTHSITIEGALFANPTTVTRSTTLVENHTHTVTLTADELRTIAAGGAIVKDTTISDSHLHTFTFVNQA